MTTQTTTLSGISVKERIMVGLTALVFGLFLVLVSGFAGSNVLHNAAHDTRHSIGFPCH
ncbi:hypothetical protein MNBD_ALPHA08-962 [hydrothermal vent metagenome]|uniref:Cobalt transporter n=1 Tax=hydrothermal vent metagenome TaxID=652676 RepID=A0A3B0RN00_9ZZZZ